jgi:hypothetical protein
VSRWTPLSTSSKAVRAASSAGVTTPSITTYGLRDARQHSTVRRAPPEGPIECDNENSVAVLDTPARSSQVIGAFQLDQRVTSRNRASLRLPTCRTSPTACGIDTQRCVEGRAIHAGLTSGKYRQPVFCVAMVELKAGKIAEQTVVQAGDG